MQISICQVVVGHFGLKSLSKNSQGDREKCTWNLHFFEKKRKEKKIQSASISTIYFSAGELRQPFPQCLCSSLTHFFNATRKLNYGQFSHCRNLKVPPTVCRISYRMTHWSMAEGTGYTEFPGGSHFANSDTDSVNLEAVKLF